MKRVLVTGASGFIGRHCLAALIDRPDVEVHAVSRKASETAGMIWHQTDLLDAAQTKTFIASLRPSHLLHAAWEATPVSYGSSPANAAWLGAGIAMLEAFAAHGGERFVGVGTSAEYTAPPMPCIETVTPVLPGSIYGHAKAAMAEAAAMLGGIHGFKVAWGRLFLPFGPGDPPQRLLPSVLAAIRDGRRIEMSDGLQNRDFIFAPDAGHMFAQLLLSDAEGAFNIGSGMPRSIRSVVEHVARLHGGEKLLAFGARPRREGEPQMLVADMTRYQALVGDIALTDFDEAVRSL